MVVWTLLEYTQVFYMIPSLKMDQITDLDSMNISAVEGDSNVFLRRRLIPKLISQVPPSTMFDITAWEKKKLYA